MSSYNLQPEIVAVAAQLSVREVRALTDVIIVSDGAPELATDGGIQVASDNAATLEVATSDEPAEVADA